MYFTHHFAHRETLARARSWLTELGVKPHQLKTHKAGALRISLSIAPEEWPKVSLLFNALERNDPVRVSSFWDLAQDSPSSVQEVPDSAPGEPSQIPRRRTAIGWHPLD